MYILCQSHKREGSYDKAAEICERLVLRDPEHMDYLINLADCYRLAGNPERAQEVTERARNLNPSDAHVHRMAELLSRR